MEINLDPNLFNPSFPGICKEHGNTPFMKVFFPVMEGGFPDVEGSVCVQCWNDMQRAYFDAQSEAMRAAGHKVERLTFVGRKWT